MFTTKNMDMSAVCRTCLRDECLNPIFLNPDDHKRYSTALYITTGIKVEFNDGLPQKMCTSCINYLNNCLQFRKKCRETEAQLLKIKHELDGLQNSNFVEENLANHAQIKKRQIAKYSSEEKSKDCFELEVEVNSDMIDELGADTVVKIESMNKGDLEDEDDIPLKYLLDTELDNEEVNIILFIENPLQEKEKKEVDEILEKNNKTDLTKPPYLAADPTRKRVTCQLCQKNLSIRSIDTHMARSHPGADERKVKCEFCDSYVMKDKMGRHRKQMHGSEKALRCGYCKSEFDSKEVLVNHVTTCTAKKKKRTVSESGRALRECDVCHKTMQKASLRMHKAIKHAGLGPVCEHCGRRLGNKFRLNEHYRAKHGYEKFKCSYCDFQSAAVMAMRNHERRHRGEKPFVCDACGAKFHAAYLLAQHKQSHRTEKLHKCEQCPASFKANNSLHMHRLTCHSAHAYSCALCPRAYSCRHYAVKHLRHAHGHTGPVPPLHRTPNPSHTARSDLDHTAHPDLEHTAHSDLEHTAGHSDL